VKYATPTVTRDVELVLDAHARIGEGPVWDQRDELLVWVDIERGELHRLDPLTGHDDSVVFQGQLGAAVPRASGGYVLARGDGYYGYEPDRTPELIVPIESDDPKTRINDARCDSVGRIWGGTVEDDLSPGYCALYCVAADATATCVLTGVTVSNGLDWSPDGQTMYYVDSHAYAVQAFDFDVQTATIANGRRLVEYDRQPWVFPDGLTVDEDGFLWVAIFGAGAVHRYSPDGSLERIIEVPVSLVTSCGFGSADLEDLYITSATHVLEPGEAARQPKAGGIYRHRPGVRGRPQHAYAG
jgi:sugar lactone lactonase YvrE